jgi:hypothetical protein
VGARHVIGEAQAAKPSGASAMIENPFLTPPQVEGPESRSWASGFLFGFQGPEFSVAAPSDLPIEDLPAFEMGTVTGQQAAIDGWPTTDQCIDLNVEPPELIHFAADLIIEGGFSVAGMALIGVHVAGLFFEGIIAIVNLSIALETFSDDPSTALAEAAQGLQGSMLELGVTASMELFIGGGVDLQATGCELLMTPIFRSQEAAASAARALGRSEWLVVAWRTDQSGGMHIVETNV